MKHWRVSYRFYVDGEKFVAAPTEAQAIRKVRDRVIKTRKLKVSDFAKDEVQTYDFD